MLSPTVCTSMNIQTRVASSNLRQWYIHNRENNNVWKTPRVRQFCAYLRLSTHERWASRYSDRCVPAFTAGCCRYKIDIAYNLRPLQSGCAAGAKILDYYKSPSVITGSDLGNAPPPADRAGIAGSFTIANEAHRRAFRSSRLFNRTCWRELPLRRGLWKSAANFRPGPAVTADLL